MKSVSEASANTTAASTSPAGVLPSSATTSAGTSMMRSTVSRLGRLAGNTVSEIMDRRGGRERLLYPTLPRALRPTPPRRRRARPSAGSGTEQLDEQTHAWTKRPRGLRDRSRLHGHVGVLRRDRRGRSAAHDPEGAR